MTASSEFSKNFRIKHLRNIYVEKIRDSQAIGIDRMRPSNLHKVLNEELRIIIKKARSGTYEFTKYKQKLVSKGATKPPRILSIPTARDRIVLRALCELLQATFPEAIQEIPQKKIEDLKSALDSGVYQEFVKLDLQDFYGSIQHDKLIKALKKRIRKKEILSILTRAIETPSIPEGTSSSKVAKKTIGVPQGLSISNQLAEITIKEIDNIFSARPDVAYFRYVDDILILTPKNLSLQIANEAIEALQENGFIVHDPKKQNSKSQIGPLTEEFSFLGYRICDNLLSVRKESIRKLESAIAAILTSYRHRVSLAKSPEQRDAAISLCKWRLNLKITGCIFDGQRRGWVFYFSQINNTSCLRALQHTVTALLQRFGMAKTLNPKSFIKAHYESRRQDKTTHRYIPNFDEMSISGMREVLSLFLGAAQVSKLSDKRVEQFFKMRIRHAVKELEADLAGVS